MIGRLVRLICMTVMVSSAFMLPASAATDLGLSRDGVHWSGSLTQPLFDSDFRWVPGDVQTAQFFVRNQSTTGAELTVNVRATGDTRLLNADDIQLQARAASGKWVNIDDRQHADRLNASVIKAGSVVPVAIRATFDSRSTNQSQLRTVKIQFVVNLSQSLRSADTAGESDSSLPGTGAPEVLWFVAFGAILIGAGASVLAGRHKEEAYV